MSLADATRQYLQGDYSAALASLNDCANGPDASAAIMLMAKCYVGQGHVEGLGRIINFVQQSGGAPEQAVFHILSGCLQDGLHAPLVALEPAFPENTLLFPIALYHASCARMMLGDEAGAAKGFDRFRLAMPKYLAALPFGTDDAFNTMFRQATLVLPPDETALRVAQGRDMPSAQSEFSWLRELAGEDAGPAFLCCADARYVAAFLGRWLSLLAPFGRAAHVHIVDPDVESEGIVENAAAESGMGGRLGISTSRDRFGTSTSYSCARFEIVPHLLQQHRRPFIAIDIDSGATEALGQLADALPAADFAGFESGRNEPASVHPAGVMIFAPTEPGMSFAQDLAAYCRPRLHLPARLSWMLDQAALHSVIRLYRRDRPDFRYVALDRFTSRPMGDHIHGLASDEEKQAIKAKSAGLGGASPKDTVNASWTP